MFRKMGADTRRTFSPDENKRGFKPKQVLAEDIQCSQKSGKNKTFSLIEKTAQKVLRWAYISVPAIVLPACSAVNNDKLNVAHMSMATIGSITLALFAAIGVISGIQKAVNHFKNKKENKIESA